MIPLANFLVMCASYLVFFFMNARFDLRIKSAEVNIKIFLAVVVVQAFENTELIARCGCGIVRNTILVCTVVKILPFTRVLTNPRALTTHAVSDDVCRAGGGVDHVRLRLAGERGGNRRLGVIFDIPLFNARLGRGAPLFAGAESSPGRNVVNVLYNVMRDMISFG